MAKITVPLLFSVLLAAAASAAPEGPEAETGAPAALRPWAEWVLRGQEEARLCPGEADGRRRCAWPLSLELDLNDQGGRFTAALELKREMAFPLPGGPGAWPRAATLADGSAVPILGRERPEVFLPAGRHVLTGSFQWPRPPETIDLPLGFLLKLKINGRELDFPPMEVDYAANSARLWLTAAAVSEGAPEGTGETADRLTVTVNRLIEDAQPMMIKTRLKLVVSGREREATLKQALLPGAQAIFLSSPLPARLAEEGLRVRLKPGVYDLFLDSRAPDRAETLGPTDPETAEYWAFKARDDLRLAEISGAEQIDPSQADFYPPWSSFPLYAVPPGGSLTFATLRRGDPDPPPDLLRLRRECWLDFDGRGLSCRDALSGLLNREWRINAGAPFTLAQASLNGEPQVITWQTDSKGRPAPGLQLRESRLDLSADLRLAEFDGRLPASGWDHDLEAEAQKINLPPGYRLWHVSGAESRTAWGSPGSWTESWTVLDFFLVLLISVAAGRLYGPAAGLLALAALTAAYHEPLAPRWVFPCLLAATALSRKIPPRGRAGSLIKICRLAACLVLTAQTVLFVAHQAQLALHPQLEKSLTGGGYESGRGFADARRDSYYEDEEAILMEETPAAAPVAEMKMNRAAVSSLSGAPAAAPAPSRARARLDRAADAKVQNSLPRPDWNWNSVYLHYNETVGAERETRLWLTGPAGWRLGGFLRLILMSLLSFTLIAGRRPRRPAAPLAASAGTVAGATAAGTAVMLLLMLSSGQARAQSAFPSRELLEDYKARLLERRPLPPPSLAHLRLTPSAEKLEFDLTVEAGREEIIPLPLLDRAFFRPAGLLLDGRKEPPLLEVEGRLLTLVPAGRHKLVFTGKLKKADRSFQALSLSFPLVPQVVEAAENPYWRVEGLAPDGRLTGRALRLTALAIPGEQAENPAERTELTLSPFFLAHRSLSLGLEWRATTQARRLTPLGAPATLTLPLLPGENSLSGAARVQDGLATIDFGPQDETVVWESSLETAPEIVLTAAQGPWAETWSLDAAPLWKVETSGLAPIHYAQNGSWRPQWQPWPGESLRIAVSRPQPVPGRYLVADEAKLLLTVGENAEKADLDFKVRASQGGLFNFTPPEGVEIREFAVDGVPAPLGAKTAGAPLTASLSAGTHELSVRWSREKPLGFLTETPALNLGLPAANLSAALVLPENRWILWTWGPLSGPAVQFWSLLAVTFVASLFLGRLKGLPLGRLSWFLLSWGLLRFHLLGALLVVGWLLALAWRRRKPLKNDSSFNAGQVGLALWTAAALWAIFQGVKLGLLENPDMLIAGGGSYGQHLRWFTDVTEGAWPQGRVLSISIWYYKALMLAWSLWLAASLINWLKWAWAAFSWGGFWRPRPRRSRPEENAGAARGAEGE